MGVPRGPGRPKGPRPSEPTGYHSRSERRSTRREAQRKRTAGRLLWVAAPIIAGVVVIAALFAFVVMPYEGEGAGVSSTTASTVATGSRGGGLLVLEQDGRVVDAALIYPRPGGGIVLTVPGLTLLKSGDRFAVVAQLFAADQQAASADPLAEALGVPVEAVASIEWADLRASLADAGIDPLPPAGLDAAGADAAALAGALAAFIDRNDSMAAGPDWEAPSFRDDAGRFLAAIADALAAGGSGGWSGQALTGAVMQEGDVTYLEPDIDGARKALGVVGGTEG
jgi:hypothetical protein